MVSSNARLDVRTNARMSANAGANTGAKIRPKVGLGRLGGFAEWLLGRLCRAGRPVPRLQLVERITLGPRQTLSLVEAEGRRVLVATSPEGAPAFYAIDGAMGVDSVRAVTRARARASTGAAW